MKPPSRPGRVAPGRKTYSHLAGQRRMPTEYELVTTQLDYFTKRGFELDVPVRGWYERHQAGSPLKARDWERLRDPRETTYTTYTSLQSRREIFVDGILQSIEETAYDERLSEAWRGTLGRVLAPSRFLFHGLQMVAAYIGQMAPGGRIIVAALFQAADEVRRVQRVAYRMRLLQRAHPGFGEESRALWQGDPQWQPLREAVERLLVTFDWGEAFVALNLGMKPVLDELFTTALAALAASRGDPLLAEILFSLREDCAWHRAWSRALVEVAVDDVPENGALIRGWLEKWSPLARRAVLALAPAFSEAGPDAAEAVFASHDAYLNSLGLGAPRWGGEGGQERDLEGNGRL